MREKATAVVLAVILGFYCLTIAWRGVELVRDGRPAAVALGVAVVLLPLVLLAAMVPLLRLARDGSRMMAQLRAGASGGPEDAAWHTQLEEAERCRVARDRKGEQRHYRAAVRAWRRARQPAGD